jgi:hypothetical protein
MSAYFIDQYFTTVVADTFEKFLDFYYETWNALVKVTAFTHYLNKPGW